jgi:predicted aspartyl protease
MRPLAATLAALFLMLPLAASGAVKLTPDASGHLLVPVFVNGEGPYPFILDTGADETAVYQWFAEGRHLPKGRTAELSGATGNAQETLRRIDRLSLDEHAIRRVEVDTVPDRSDGARIAGIVGLDVFMGRLLVLDTGCGTAALRPLTVDPAGVAGPGAQMIHAGAIEQGKQLTLPITLNGAAGVATLDTGARSTMINTAFARAAGVDPASAAFKDGAPARGATQIAFGSRIGPIGTVVFGGLTRRNVVARVADLPMFDDHGYVGGRGFNLGVDLLHDVRLTIDYRTRRVWLAPSACSVASGSQR